MLLKFLNKIAINILLARRC